MRLNWKSVVGTHESGEKIKVKTRLVQKPDRGKEKYESVCGIARQWRNGDEDDTKKQIIRYFFFMVHLFVCEMLLSLLKLFQLAQKEYLQYPPLPPHTQTNNFSGRSSCRMDLRNVKLLKNLTPMFCPPSVNMLSRPIHGIRTSE